MLENQSNDAAFDFLLLPLPQAGSSKIVFASNRDGSMQIYSMNSDGSAQTRLTYSGANDDNPRWLPNGMKILFQSDRDHPDTGYMDLYVMNSDGSGVTRLTTDANDDSAAAWSPNGSRIAFQSLRNDSYYQVYTMNAVGHGQVNLSNSSANDSQPSWSADGTKIAFASDRDQAGFSSIYVMDAFGGSQTRLTFSGGGRRDEEPAWSPDGTKVAFTRTRDSIVVTWQETDDDGGIITKSELRVNKEIYVMNSDGTNQIRLTNDLGNDDSPNWSADGTKIIFRSDRERDWSDPTSQVWIMNPDGSNQTNLSSSGNGDYGASWASNAANQPPVANAGGPYNGFTSQAVNFNGGSFDPDGTITSYSWNFGDGGTSASPGSSHAYSTAGTYTVTMTVTDNLGAQASGTTTATITTASGNQSTASDGDGSSVSPDATARPVTINFDTVPANIVLPTNQYPIASFSTNTQYGANIRTINDGGVGGSPPNGIESIVNFLSSVFNDDVYVNFATPVNGLTFRVLDGVVPNDVSSIFPKCDVDVYVNHSYYGTYSIYQNGGSGAPISVNALSGIPHITGITIRYNFNCASRFCNFEYPLIYDDFTFTPELSVDITNPRVSGGLDQTTRNALLGADIILQAGAKMNGATVSGGTYAWTFTGPPVSVSGGGQNASSVTIRSTETTINAGMINAKVTYTLNGVSVTANVNIDVVLPTVTSFTANQTGTTVASPGTCGDGFNWWWFRLGCQALQSDGIKFSTSVHAPTFISNPAQSGIKYVQAVSTFRKRISRGLRCTTKRSDELNVGSGWQLDTEDPYVFPEYPVHYFSEGNDLTMPTVDSPGNALTRISSYDFVDSLYVDDQFEMYVVYFTTNTPAIQKPLGKLPWNWGGLVVFDWASTDALHNVRFSTVLPISRTSQATNVMVPMQGNVKDNLDVPCPDGPAITTNKIDSSRYFVRQHYLDFLGRDPLGDSAHAPDPVGWNFWTSGMSKCVFDLNCIHSNRVNTGLAFFYSSEFIGTDPDMANPPGTPGFNAAVYNRRFVFWCYKKYLLKEPDPEGWQFWTDVLNSDGDYAHMIDSFQLSGDYRNRLGF